MLKVCRTLFSVTISILLLCFGVVTAGAHSGRTDSRGGHKDNVHGGYHYHCGGHSAHQHPNGVCPYSAKSYTANTQAATERETATETVTATAIQSTITQPSTTNKVIPTVSFQSDDLTTNVAADGDKAEGICKKEPYRLLRYGSFSVSLWCFLSYRKSLTGNLRQRQSR